MKKSYYLPLFLLLAAIQLFVPVKMVIEQESILEKGKPYKFKTAPVDPSDPFRGKYITLRFEAEQYRTSDTTEWKNQQIAYVYLSKDIDGFARVEEVRREPPSEERDYFEAKIQHFSIYDQMAQIDLSFPFDRFYMKETKAADAEEAYRKALREERDNIYALVYVKNGKTVLEDVRIGEQSIKEVVSKKE